MTMRIMFCYCLIVLVTSKSFAKNVITIHDTIEWKVSDQREFTLHYTKEDETMINAINNYLRSGVGFVTGFFDQAFLKRFDVYIFPDRTLLDKQWQKDWGDSTFRSQCWMIASGVAHRLDVLSPKTWNVQACDHNGNDTTEIRQVIWHELVHVFHGQYNPDHSFTYIEKLDWLVEGVATYVSGQLTGKRKERIKELIAEKKIPATLDNFWKGPEKYGLSGSLVAYIDKVYGRRKLFELLKFTNKQDALQFLGTTEAQLIADWQNSLK